MLNHCNLVSKKVCQIIRRNFKSATLNFIFIFLFINLFQKLFGPENSITAVVLIIIMPSSMLRDFTLAPVKHLIRQFLILEAMTVSAFLVTSLNPYAAIPINFMMLLFLLYTLTYEYAADLYAPYILSYLFLIFISPVDAQHLLKRMIAMLIGAICIILYQFVRGHSRAEKTVRDALTVMLDEARQCIQCLLLGEGIPLRQETARDSLYKLTHLIDDHRKGNLRVSDASLAMLGCGLKLKKLIHILYHIEGVISHDRAIVLRNTDAMLESFRTFITRQNDSLAPVEIQDFSCIKRDFGEKIYQNIASIQECLVHMNDTKKRSTYRQTCLSLSLRFRITVDTSPVRIAYSLRIAALLAILTLLVQLWQLPHGKWLLFTVASVSLPYADDVGPKAAKRLFATLLGGCLSVLAFACIPSLLGRTLVMLSFGYLTSYFSDYRFTFSCSTVGAIGGAVATGIVGWSGVGGIFIIRLVYICVGIVVAYVLNCLVFPVKHHSANKQLWEKYLGTIKLLTKVYPIRTMEPQLYYGLIIHELLQAEKLQANLSFDDRGKMKEFLTRYCSQSHAVSHHTGLTGHDWR